MGHILRGNIMTATLKAFTAISTIFCALSSASAVGVNINAIKINGPNIAPTIK
jgi:hypothetical protein